MAVELVEPGATTETKGAVVPGTDKAQAAEARLDEIVAAAAAEHATQEAEAVEANDEAAAKADETAPPAALTTNQKTGIEAAIKLAELRGGLQLDDGTIVPTEQVREHMRNLSNKQKWETAQHQRGEALNAQEARIQYGLRIQHLAANDPRFDKGVMELERSLYGGGNGTAAPAQGQPDANDDLTVTPPQGYENDPLLVELAKQMTEKLGRGLTNAERRATEIVEQRMQRLQPVQDYVGRLAGEKMAVYVRKGLEGLHIAPTPEIMQNISATAARLGVDEYNPDAEIDAFGIVTRPYLIQQLTGGNPSGTVAATPKPPVTAPTSGGAGASTASASEKLTPEELTGYKFWADEQRENDPKARPTVSAWRKELEKWRRTTRR